MFKLVLEKAEEPEIKLPTSAESWKKQESSRKTSISALLTMPKPLTVWITKKLWKILQDIRTPDHLTCLLRNLYAGQETTVRTRHETMEWFQIGKGVQQGYIFSLCLLNLNAEISSVAQSCPTLCNPMDCSKLWKFLKEMGIPDHLTCLLRNLYAGQEATVRTGHGTISSVQSLSHV